MTDADLMKQMAEALEKYAEKCAFRASPVTAMTEGRMPDTKRTRTAKETRNAK